MEVTEETLDPELMIAKAIVSVQEIISVLHQIQGIQIKLETETNINQAINLMIVSRHCLQEGWSKLCLG